MEAKETTSKDSKDFEVCRYRRLKKDKKKSSEMCLEYTESLVEYMTRAYKNRERFGYARHMPIGKRNHKKYLRSIQYRCKNSGVSKRVTETDPGRKRCEMNDKVHKCALRKGWLVDRRGEHLPRSSTDSTLTNRDRNFLEAVRMDE